MPNTPPALPHSASYRRALVLLLLGTVIVHTTMFLSKPVVSYRVLALGGGEHEVGLVSAASSLLPIFFAIPMGRWSDRGRVPVLLLGGTVALVAGPIGLGHAGTILGVALVNAAYGAGLLALMVGGQSVVAGLSGPGERDRNFGLFTAAASLGQMLGPLAGGWAMSFAEGESRLQATTRAFTAGAAIALGVAVAFGAMVWVLRGTAALASSTHGTNERAGHGSALALLADRQLAVAVFVSFAFIASVDLLIAYLPVLGEHYGLSPAFVGALLALRAGCSFISRVFLGVLVRWGGRLTVIIISAGVAAVTMVGLVLFSHPVLLAVVMVLLGLTLGLGQPLTMTWVVEQAPQRLRATALALRITGNRVAQSAAPAAAGGLSSLVGIAGPFVLATALLGAAATTVLPFRRRAR
ncbi:MAG: MFS transporter [Actinophytocola sp.]|nr:MFS transporter [Actinophytocola sp.]